MFLIFFVFIFFIILNDNSIIHWKILENKIFPTLNSKHLCRKYKKIKFDINNEIFLVNLTYITRKNFERKPKYILLCLHGTAGASTNYLPIESILDNDYDFYSIDLPGFGKSKCKQILKLSSKNADFFIKFYIKTLNEFIKLLELDNIILIGHSFGGFIASNYVEYFPDKIKQLILIDSAGLTPTLGDLGCYYGILFKLGFPYFIKFINKNFIYIIAKLISPSHNFYYWLELYTNSHTFGDKVVSLFISINNKGMWWNTPVLQSLINIKCPIKFIYGEADNLMPSHQGKLICLIRNTPNNIYIIPNYFHNPIPGINSTLLHNILHNGNNNFTSKNIILDIKFEDFISTFNRNKTKKIIYSLYKKIIQQINN
jgi:pimeloyl-ACP methyl ester carboxylesterase